MEIAINRDNERIHASIADKEQEYFCPICGGKVIPRQGQVKMDHFAHQSKCDDAWHYEMTAWHSDWQNQFPRKNQEVVVEIDGEKHRADVMACGYVIEFQHSPITAEEFEERNRFYLHYGKKVIWIFDLSAAFSNKKIIYVDEWSRNHEHGGKFKWSYSKKFLQSYLPQNNKKIIVFFQFFDSDHSNQEASYMERVTWAINENGYSNFSHFYTSYSNPVNAKELLKWIKEHKL